MLRQAIDRGTPYMVSFFLGTIAVLVGMAGGLPGKTSWIFVGMASIFFATPVIFGIFKMMANARSYRMKKLIQDCAVFEIDGIILELILELKELLNDREKLTNSNLDCFLSLSPDEIRKKLVVNEDIARKFEKIRKKIVFVLHDLRGRDILDGRRGAELISLVIEVDTLVMAMRCRLSQKIMKKNDLAKTVETILEDVLKWINEGSSSILEHRYFEFLVEDDTDEKD